jgi:hypothetical protein
MPARLRRRARTGRPWGDPRLLARLEKRLGRRLQKQHPGPRPRHVRHGDKRRVAALAATLREKLEAQKAIKAPEPVRNKKPRELFDAQDAIDQQRDGLIGKIESQMRQRHNVTRLFGIRWGLK